MARAAAKKKPLIASMPRLKDLVFIYSGHAQRLRRVGRRARAPLALEKNAMPKSLLTFYFLHPPHARSPRRNAFFCLAVQQIA